MSPPRGGLWLALLLAGCASTPVRVASGRCSVVGAADEAAALFERLRTPIVLGGNAALVCPCAAQAHSIGFEAEPRTITTTRDRRRVDGVTAERRVDAVEKPRTVDGISERRALDEPKPDAHSLDGVSESRRVEIPGENRQVDGASERRTPVLSCTEDVGCSGYVVTGAEVFVFDSAGRHPLINGCVSGRTSR